MKFFIGRFYVNLVLKFNIKLELLEEDIMGMEEIKKWRVLYKNIFVGLFEYFSGNSFLRWYLIIKIELKI